jgi:hypothetical protein
VSDSSYNERELEMYERGRKAGHTAGYIEGVSDTIAAMTDAGRALAKKARAKPKRQPLKIMDFVTALMEST